MPARVDPPAEKKTQGDSEFALEECTALETDLAELKANYDQFFIGIDRAPPTRKHEAIKRRMAALKAMFVRQTAVKFRVQAVAAKLVTYERLWDRTLKEIESGTYKRDLFKARLHQQQRGVKKPAAAEQAHPDEDLDLSDLDDDAPSDLQAELESAAATVKPLAPVAPLKPVPAARPLVITSPELKVPGLPELPSLKPAPASLPQVRPITTGSNPVLRAPATSPPRPAPAPVGTQDGLSDSKIKAIYEAYVMAKKRCGEDTRSLTLDSVASSLKKQVPELMRQHNARSVEFKVVIKDGKAVLRALPKET